MNIYKWFERKTFTRKQRIVGYISLAFFHLFAIIFLSIIIYVEVDTRTTDSGLTIGKVSIANMLFLATSVCSFVYSVKESYREIKESE